MHSGERTRCGLVVAVLAMSSWVACGGGSSVAPPAPASLQYADNPAAYTLDVAITANAPTVTGAVDSYTVTPALPTGLSLDPITGMLSGTPTVSAAAADYTVTAQNRGGSIAVTLRVGVSVLPLTITTQPTSTVVHEGASATFTVTASGSGTLAYQWSRSGTPISGANGASHTTGVLARDDDATFAVTVSDTHAGSVTSDTVRVDVFAGAFTAGPMLSAGRIRHTSTALRDGTVLVAGGLGAGGSADRYDVAAGTLAATGAMLGERSDAVAVLLGDGRVLIAGGAGAGNVPLDTAEVFDPISGSFAATVGDMTAARTLHTAVLLPTGKVLVVGGWNGSTNEPTAELFDPSTGTFSATGSPAAARQQPILVPLGDGGVLLAGGYTGSVTAAAERYDPVAGTWSNIGSMTTARYSAAAAPLPDGRVLIAGGADVELAPLASCEIFDPVTDTFVATGSLRDARVEATAALLASGEVLILGGLGPPSGNYVTLTSAERFDPVAGTWQPTATLTTARQKHAMSLLPTGDVLISGGGFDVAADATTEIFDPEDLAPGEFVATGALAASRQFAPAVLLGNGKVLVCGASPYVATAELYDPSTGAWTATGSMANARMLHTATLLPNGKVLVCGGYDGAPMASAELFDPVAGTFSASTSSLGTARYAATATLLPSGIVLIVGGSGGGILMSAELYDWQTDSFAATGSMTTPREDHVAVLLGDGSVLVTGGYAAASTATSTSERYDPSSGTFQPAGAMSFARARFTAIRLYDGRTLVAGGEGPTLTAVTETYSPTADTFTNAATSYAGSYGVMATLPNGDVLRSSGFDTASLTTAMIFSPTLGTWTATSNGPDDPQTAIRLGDGSVLLIGIVNCWLYR